MVSVSPQVLPPFLAAERSVLQRDGLCWPGAHAQVSANGAQIFVWFTPKLLSGLMVPGSDRKPTGL